jgi:uncharacterized coiled-coil DUF342 family protein
MAENEKQTSTTKVKIALIAIREKLGIRRDFVPLGAAAAIYDDLKALDSIVGELVELEAENDELSLHADAAIGQRDAMRGQVDTLADQRDEIIRELEERGLWKEIKAIVEERLKKKHSGPRMIGVMKGISE